MMLNKSAYGKGTNYMQEIVEYHGQNCYIPSSCHCFVKCNNYVSKKYYTEELLTFIRAEQRRSNVMTATRFQPFCRKNNIKIGCFDRTRIKSRNLTQRKTSLFKYNNHLSLNWEINGISFNQVIEDEFKPKFKVVDNVISDEHVLLKFY